MNHDESHMRRALEVATLGRGHVEPNPMVGCVIADNEKVLGEGWHKKFGGPHAEIEALVVAGEAARGATMYVTLEPCCHHGKTPPCTQAVIAAGIRRVVIAMSDPFPKVSGGGITELRQAGIEIRVGVLEREASDLNAPYLRLVRDGRPWVIAKWAMTLDGKTATRTGDSRWVSNESSREVVHAIRGRVDAILVGRRTVELDDPMLNARPAGPRLATRVVLDSTASIPLGSRLVQTSREVPVLVVVAEGAAAERIAALEAAGCEVVTIGGTRWPERIHETLSELGRRRMTNLLVEGGAVTLGGFLDARRIDEVHVFISPKIAGGAEATTGISGTGIEKMAEALALASPTIDWCGGDVYVRGRIASG